jgi:hypothetical protein
MPDEADLRGARGVCALAGLASRRVTDRAWLEDTRGFFEQIGQFSTSRL